jgi:3-hydroxyisobutyrate dehydrogenase-like beta-hydroxyacid dehydrogenase
MAHIAFLGTGLLGSAFAEAAVKRGDTVTAWNRSPDKVLALAKFGVEAAARNAQGLMLATGPRALFESVQADLARMTGRLDYMGERADLAAVNKLLGNAMIIGVSAVMADVLTLAKACGVDVGDAVGLLGALDMNAIVARRGKSMATRDFTPSFELVMARKDVQLMLETSGGLPLATLPAVAARMDELIAAGHGAQDSAVLAIDAVRRA